jgi:hypothetical protein
VNDDEVMDGWTVIIDAAANPGPYDGAFLDRFSNNLGHAASVSILPDGSRFSAIFSLELDEAATAGDAAALGIRLFSDAAAEAQMPFPIVRLEVMTFAEQEADLRKPAIPELVGISEIAKEIGVTRQRASKLARQPGFPAPAFELASGPVWTRPSLERFIDEWERKPGRPRSADANWLLNDPVMLPKPGDRMPGPDGDEYRITAVSVTEDDRMEHAEIRVYGMRIPTS